MPNREKLLLDMADYILVVNKDYEIVYNSRFDKRMGADLTTKPYKNFFEMYPSIGVGNSSIVKAMSTGEPVFNEIQEWTDINGKVYVTKNITLPLLSKGHVVGVVELTKDLTSVGNLEKKPDSLESLEKDGRFHPNRDANDRTTFEDILTINDSMLSTIEQAKLFSMNSNPILIYGETGTGKEMFAQAIINYMVYPKQKVVIQNCAAVPDNLIEGILFGTTRGSYTGAENKKGLFEEADGGIFFLDELNALPYAVQGKLLRVLQEGTFRPLGASKEKKVKVKIIAAMNIDPMEAIEKGILRRDLFYRLSSNMIYLPPLRERPDDIEYLTDNYIDYFNDMYGKNVKGISEELRAFFLSYDWEGNVRELKHVIESMITMTESETLDMRDIPVYLNSKSKGEVRKRSEPAPDDSKVVIDLEGEDMSLTDAVDLLEREMILKALEKCGGNKTKASEVLGIPRQTLKYKMDKLKIYDLKLR
ncbi:MAG: sigma 54-interacting transcriptional regulator [Firmicutes bacterium]|nr:sigma 54-interacting transcriptional regulator [Bacillota bacterium]